MSLCDCDAVAGNFGIGSSAPDPVSQLKINANFGVASDNNGLYLSALQTVPGGVTLRGVRADLSYQGSGILQGMNATDFTFIVNNGTVNFAKSFNTWGIVNSGATVGEIRMIDIATPAKNGTAVINTLYGLRLGNMNVGTTNWAIYSEGGNCYLAGNVGLGTAPVNKLDVEGGAAIGAAYSGSNVAPANGLIVEGKVGIGTATPVNKLDVEGAAAIGSAYSGANAGPPDGLIVQGNVGLGTAAPVNKLDVEGAAAIGSAYSGTNTGPTDGLIVQGNVGLGTPTPVNKLDVEGAAAIGAAYSGTQPAPANSLIVEGKVGIGTFAPANKLDVEGAAAIGAAYSGGAIAPPEGLIVQGFVGMGTASPQGSLHVRTPNARNLKVVGAGVGTNLDNTDDNGNVTSLVIRSADLQVATGPGTNPPNRFGVFGNGNSYHIGNLGIGTEMPLAPLHIRHPNQLSFRIYPAGTVGTNLESANDAGNMQALFTRSLDFNVLTGSGPNPLPRFSVTPTGEVWVGPRVAFNNLGQPLYA